MTDINEFEVPRRFPYMDTGTAYSNGRFGSAHERRMQILGNNRLVARGHEGFHMVNDSDDGTILTLEQQRSV